jgi:hypothetical protein
MGFETGIALPYAAAPAEQDALAQMRPLSLGANPIQIQGMAPWQVPETKPYLAQGIAKAMETIGAGIKARYDEKKADKKEEAKSKFEREKLAEQIRHNKELEKSTQSRIDAVASGKLKQQEESEDVMGDEADSQVNERPIGATYTPPANLPKTSSIEPQVGELQGIVTASPLIPSKQTVTLSGVSMGGPVMSVSAAPIQPLSPAPTVELTPAQEEAEIVKKGGLSSLPLPTFEPQKSKEEPKKEELPAIGTPAGDKDTSLVDAVKNPPALGVLGEPLLQPEESKAKGTLAGVKGIQEVDQRDMRYRFGDRPDLANRQALLFNKKYPFAAVQAEVKEPSKSVPYWHIDYKDVSKERRGEFRTVEEHAATQGLKQQRLDISREAKVMAMANNYEKHPTSKLMDTRKDAMQRMLVAIQEDKHARESNDAASLGLIHQEMMDLFAQFASGKAPTEAQFSETKHAFSGLSGWQNIAKKVQFWKSGAKLDERDVRTMQDLMLNTYNTSADQVNSQLTTIESILKSENPNISPMKLPVQYPLLKTKEFLKEQLGGKDPEQALTEYAKLRGEYFDDATGTFKKPMPQDKREQFLKLKPIAEEYSALKNNSFIPPNLHELKHPKKEVFGPHTYFKVPGFHASYFSAPPASSLATEGHYQGSGE